MAGILSKNKWIVAVWVAVLAASITAGIFMIEETKPKPDTRAHRKGIPIYHEVFLDTAKNQIK
ncbi:MAG: hypothetical protein LBO71_09455 [Prevotellaceae bacterium]|jgi:hypothetical protein|nr:hypothetical protein [Prevotellaceae bacterium]